MVKLVRMVTLEEQQIACDKGYVLACQILQDKKQGKDIILNEATSSPSYQIAQDKQQQPPVTFSFKRPF